MKLIATIEWHPVTEPPQQSGYVLLGCTHHDIPTVLMGHCKLRKGLPPVYREETYNGRGVAITHWAHTPTHPSELPDRSTP